MVTPEEIFTLLPLTLRQTLERLDASALSEIRLRRDRPVAVTAGGENRTLPVVADGALLGELVSALCGGCYHAHAAEIEEGYISWNGVRVGVCGRMGDNGALREILALNIRIPHRVSGSADVLVRALARRRFACGTLICGLPGDGKTTLLRDAADQISTRFSRRVALIESRCELWDESMRGMIDPLIGIGKARGILLATRTLSPQLIICDEIGGREEAEAILSVLNAGVPLLASAHCGDERALLRRQPLRMLLENGVFGLVGFIERAPRERLLRLCDAESILAKEAVAV